MASNRLGLSNGGNTLIQLCFGKDAEVTGWVAEKIGYPDFGPCTAIGVVKDGIPIAGVVYSNYCHYKGNPISVEISCAASDKRWTSREILKSLFLYPFVQLGVERVQVSIPVESKGVRKFNEKLGFKYEGTGRKAHFLGGDMDVLSMLKHECLWIK